MYETVTSDQILSASPGGVEALTPKERAGMNIVLGIGIIAVVALAFLMTAWITRTPPRMSLPPSTSSASEASATAAAIQNWGTAAKLAAQQPLAWFEALFTKLLYPLLTLVLGYVFGTAKTSKE